MPDQAQRWAYWNAGTTRATHAEITRVGAIIEIVLIDSTVNAIEYAMNRELGEAFSTLNDFHLSQM